MQMDNSMQRNHLYKFYLQLRMAWRGTKDELIYQDKYISAHKLK